MSVPLSLYVHVPWCVRKCPYCDFNSHPANGPLPDEAYVAQLLRDLDQDEPLADGRSIRTIFIGGGTPSLMSGRAIGKLLDGVRARSSVDANVEITLEANPGAVDERHFAEYRAAGVNRLSIGAQTFDAELLERLGRIHSPSEIGRAVAAARRAGFERLNIDLMHGLPGQTVQGAANDLARALDLGVSHLSWYQLTIEPRTQFALHRPRLPDDDTLAAIEQEGFAQLAAAGFARYEVSAFCRPGEEARHNVNYWTFGDYLGIGAGAHGKLSQPSLRAAIRTHKPPAPSRYLGSSPEALRRTTSVSIRDLPGEFMLNALRLVDGVDPDVYVERTGLPLATIEPVWREQCEAGLMRADRLALTGFGLRYLDSVVGAFL